MVTSQIPQRLWIKIANYNGGLLDVKLYYEDTESAFDVPAVHRWEHVFYVFAILDLLRQQIIL